MENNIKETNIVLRVHSTNASYKTICNKQNNLALELLAVQVFNVYFEQTSWCGKRHEIWKREKNN